MPSAGQLNSLINIVKAYETTDPDSGETNVECRPYYRNVPAMCEPVSGGSTRRGLQVEETVKTVFTIAHIDDLDPHWQVEVIGKNGVVSTHEITSVIPEGDRRTWLQIHCSDIQ